jgi:RNA polymerase sigma-70 factor (ECF subfamily)
MPMQTERQLVERARRGDRDAYAALYDRYARLIRAVCYDTTGDMEHAQDLAQEVFLRAHRRLTSLRDDDRFGGWLIGIARRVQQEWLKRKRRDRRVQTGIPTQALAVDSDANIDSEQRIKHALARLPEKQRLALHLFYLQGKSAAESQKVLQMSSSGFYKLLAQASEQITQLLEAGE